MYTGEVDDNAPNTMKYASAPSRMIRDTIGARFHPNFTLFRTANTNIALCDDIAIALPKYQLLFSGKGRARECNGEGEASVPINENGPDRHRRFAYRVEAEAGDEDDSVYSEGDHFGENEETERCVQRAVGVESLYYII